MKQSMLTTVVTVACELANACTDIPCQEHTKGGVYNLHRIQW